jgi:hypothetical protein
MDSKAVEGILIGFEDNGYRVWVKNEKLIRSRDVIFKEIPLNTYGIGDRFPQERSSCDKGSQTEVIKDSSTTFV